MTETLLAILTDRNARQTEDVHATLDEAFSAGKPWWD